MLPDTPLLQLIPARAKTFLSRLESKIWLAPVALDVEWAGCSTEHVAYKDATKRKREKIRAPFCWGDKYDQAWFRLDIPQAQRDGTWFLEWKEQGESTAYISGVPYAGLDVGHFHCRIPAKTRELWMEVMCLEAGIWMPFPIKRRAITADGCRYEGARARQRDELAWSVYHDVEVLLNLLEDAYAHDPELRAPFGAAIGYAAPYTKTNPLVRRICRWLDDAINASERNGLAEAQRVLKAAYRDLSGHPELVKVRATGHAHIDLVWLWTENAANFKAVHTFATANRLMQEYPEFRFGYSQPASYRAVEARSPALMKQVRQRIHEGKWEPVGAAEVESDTLLACGEALARSLIIGQEGFIDLQGKPSEVMWLPDVFGYAACLPQILQQTGVKYFYTTKLHWSAITQFPHSSFIWRGPDGSEILSHITHGMGYVNSVYPSEARQAAREYRQSDVHGETLMPSGYGDGGGGPTAAMCERARRMADLAGCPHTAWGRIDEFFAGLEPVRAKLPAYRGELYLQYHRGVLTTHGDLKDTFRATERALQSWEAAHCLAGKGDIDRQAWRRLVFAQFHDYIPGSSVPEVYEEALPELRGIAKQAHDSAREVLAKANTPNSIFNPLPVARRELVNGKLHEIPPLSVTPLTELATVAASEVLANETELKSDLVHARFDKKGQITKLVVDSTPIDQAAPLGTLMLYPDIPHGFEAWDIDRSTLANGQRIDSPATVGVSIAKGSATLSFARQVTEKSVAKIHYTLETGSTVLRIEVETDWQDPDTLLKITFPTNYMGQDARFGGPFGSVLRSQQPGELYDEAQWEVPGSRYAVVADDTGAEGLFVVTEAKYGWTCREGNLGLSLLRSAIMPLTIGTGTATLGDTPRSDLKPHKIRLAVGRFDANAPRAELPATLADTLFTPLQAVKSPPRNSGYHGLEGGDSLLPCWAKPEGANGWVLRLHETLGRRGEARLLLDNGWSASLEDLSGHNVAEKLPRNLIKFTPYQLLSVRLKKEH